MDGSYKLYTMKQILLFTGVLTVILLQSCIQIDFDGNGWSNGISGNGDVTTETIDVDGFTGVQAGSSIDVRISQGDFNVEVVADENLQEYISVDLRDDMLVIGAERNIRRAESKMVYVSLPELRKLKVSSSGDMEAESDFECEDLYINISSSGDLKMGVEAESITINVSSSGDCRIWGRTGSLNASLSSSGDLRASDLEADYVKVRASSSSNASVWANEEADMGASSSGNIYYKGDAKVTHKNTSSSGSIRHRE